ncbi:DUF1330 domain-containing protein [Marinobacterium lutimaris]|uniref:Uncharacterized conserved protein, DUF1330 family n=1 Tax=Marinobacterium lutimaris TaxID=568106 RepID=A0A1H6AHG0_9GAMM|nr:DUF1330 domain-containing protein [Marinobacterium lutimaris]SEG47507.1 Uncharacterized conserved protein, DUF1330 family [Marinobacterium lutimaris]
MAKGYMLFTEAVLDQPLYDAYIAKVVKTITDSGGRIIMVDDSPEVLEGSWHGSRTVLLEWDSAAAAKAWYDSPEYQAIIGERHASVEANAILLHGL